MKILLLDSSYPVNTRNQRLVTSLLDNGMEVKICTWNRDGRDISEKDLGNFIFNSPSSYGQKWKKLLQLRKYARHFKQVIKLYKADIIIASHWDMLCIAAKFKPANTRLVYENLDIPTAANPFVLKILQRLENWALRKTDGIIFASRFFLPLYDGFKGDKVIIENKPSRKVAINAGIITAEKIENKEQSIRIVYVGLLRYYNILQNLVDAVKATSNVTLDFYGEGQDFDKVVAYAANDPRIHFHGKYAYEDVGKFYSNADVVWAAYPALDFNVKYAISNKFFETIMCQVPGIFAADTELGRFVAEEKIGLTVNPYDIKEITALIVNLTTQPDNLKKIKKSLIAAGGDDNYWEVEVKKISKVLKVDIIQ